MVVSAGQGTGGGVSPDLVEVRIVKHQEELVLVLEALHGMCHALGEIPDVAEVELLDLIPAELIDGRDEDGSGVDKSPFRHAMPVQLTDGALGQVLLGGGNVMTLRQILNHLLAEPSALE